MAPENMVSEPGPLIELLTTSASVRWNWSEPLLVVLPVPIDPVVPPEPTTMVVPPLMVVSDGRIATQAESARHGLESHRDVNWIEQQRFIAPDHRIDRGLDCCSVRVAGHRTVKNHPDCGGVSGKGNRRHQDQCRDRDGMAKVLIHLIGDSKCLDGQFEAEFRPLPMRAMGTFRFACEPSFRFRHCGP